MKVGPNKTFSRLRYARFCHIFLQSLIAVLHTCVSIMFKCIGTQNLIKIYHAVIE